jgi:hypothetical protein
MPNVVRDAVSLVSMKSGWNIQYTWNRPQRSSFLRGKHKEDNRRDDSMMQWSHKLALVDELWLIVYLKQQNILVPKLGVA